MALTEFQTYLADARERVAESRAAGLLETAPRYDSQIARLMAVMAQSHDRRQARPIPAFACDVREAA